MTTPPRPPRKFPAPCWTQEEALALIDAYRERWYALRRGYLRTADWDAVAADVARRCPNASITKTSAQCRHKMEKLRQRYRTEKQRALSYPGRFFSSWFFFENMDAMENGPSSAVGSNQDADNGINSGSGNQVKALIDRKSIPIGFKSKSHKKIAGGSNPDLGFYHEGIDPGGGFRLKNMAERNSVALGFRTKNCSNIDDSSDPNCGSRALNGYSSYLDNGSDQDANDGADFGGDFSGKNPIDRNLLPLGFRGKKSCRLYGNLKPNFDRNHDVDHGVDVSNLFHIDQKSAPSGFKVKKFGKIGGVLNPNFDGDEGAYEGVDDDGFHVKISRDRSSASSGFRAKNNSKIDGNPNANLDSKLLYGFPSPSKLVLGKKSDSRGVKRERGLVEEMVSSIKFLGEGFVKMEKMKMEMAREIEQMRMEMEMKRNELILESQQQIVDAFINVLMENKKQKIKVTVSPES